MIRHWVLGALGFGALFLTYLLAWPVPIEPVVYVPGPVPALTGALAPNERLGRVVRLGTGIGLGPEDVALKDGFAYTGTHDGRIFKIALSGQAAPELFVYTGGRPLGLAFDASGNLIVADAKRGLLSIAADRSVTVLVRGLGGKDFLFTDDLDIAADGVIWFSDASMRFGYGEDIADILEASATGRLLSYDPSTRETKVHLTGLYFANGVALAPDQSFVLVNETGARRIMRLWLTGEKAGTSDIFAEGLPGHPDNISADGDGRFWVALVSPLSPPLEAMAARPFLRRIVFRLSRIGLHRLGMPKPSGWVLALDAQGRVADSLMDSTGATFHGVTSVNAFGGDLYLGSIAESSIGRLPKP